MKASVFVVLFAAALPLGAAPPEPRIIPPPPPPVVASLPPAAGAPAPPPTPFVYREQTLAAPPVLVSPQRAKSIIDGFKAAYAKLGKPRLLICVNREVVEPEAGLLLAARTETRDLTRTQVKPETSSGASALPVPASTPAAPAPNAYPAGATAQIHPKLPATSQAPPTVTTEHITRHDTYRVPPQAQPSLADQQTARDVERLFGRPLRLAGATLIDETVATALLPPSPSRPFASPGEAEPARQDPQVLPKVADVAIQVFISTRNLTVAGLSGDRVYNVPDIQATAVRLRDARVLGQATATDVLGADPGRIAQSFDANAICEATALALMEDITSPGQ